MLVAIWIVGLMDEVANLIITIKSAWDNIPETEK